MNKPEFDRSVTILGHHKDDWARLPVGEKLRYLQELGQKTREVAEPWVDAAVRAKGIPSGSPLVGEEWMSGPWALLYGINRLIRTLQAIEKGHASLLKCGAVRTRANGQVVVEVFPVNIFDRLLLNGYTAEVWMQPDVTPDNLHENMASFYKQPSPEGKVVLVLGAGNIASIAPLDLLYKLFAEGHVCLLKMHPVNEYLGPFFEEIFSSFITAGFVRSAYGGADVGAYLTAHDDIDEIHLTGDAKTYDAIVYGSGRTGEKRKQRDEPISKKRVTAELGAVCPTIVAPGPWNDADLCYQAEHIVTQKSHNGGFNCAAAQVLVLPEEWDRTADLLETLRTTIRSIQPRQPYYPGAAKRQSTAVLHHPEAELLDKPSEVTVPRTLITGLDANNADEFCFMQELFADVLAQTSLPGRNAADFLRAAVRFCNETLWGTLGANIIIHPKTIKELGSILEDAIADLRYGTIGINAWTGVGFLLSQTSWGAYPGHTHADVQSGIGVVHNSMLFDKPQKSIVRAPFYSFPRGLVHGEFHLSPKPAWFVTNKQAHTLGRRLFKFEAKPGFKHLPGIFIAALRG